MKFKDILKSPVFPQGTPWKVVKRKEGYESDITAFVRAMAEDESIREDQRFAWERWRTEDELPKKP
jgi:hypothetical protein